MKTFRNIMKTAVAAFAVMAMAMSCGERRQTEPPAEFSRWIKAYSGGMLDRNSSVRIILSDPVDNDVLQALGQKDIDGLFSFSPSLKGSARIPAADIIEFIPDEGAMKPGTMYDASFRLGDLTGVRENGMEVFRFSFMTEPWKAEMSIGRVIIPSGSPDNVEISGRLTLSEPTDIQTAGSMLSCSIRGQKPSVSVTRDGEDMAFRVTGISRGTKDEKLEISLDGTSAGYSSSQKAEVIIPGKDEFKVLMARKSDSGAPHVDIFFSEPLDGTADPDGLYELTGAGRTFIKIKDNSAAIYYEKAGEDMRLTVDAGVKSAGGTRLGKDFSMEFTDNEPKPAVELLLKGNILPDKSRLILPFRAVNLYAVDLSVIRIFEDNILFFLQNNDLGGDNDLRRSGRLMARKTVRLDTDPGKNLHEWQDFSVDLSGLFRQEAGAIYRIRITFRQDYSLYGNSGAGKAEGMVTMGDNGISEEDMAVWDTPYPYYYESFYDWDKYEWQQRDNPLDPSYYMVADRFPVCNLMSSDLGVIAKSADNGKLWITVSNLMTAQPVENAEVTVYNYQLQEMARATTDKKGFAEADVKGKAFAVTVRSGHSTSYLKVTDGNEKPLSRFDVGGVKADKGLKAYIYGERGVWRPGDTLHLAMTVLDKENAIPDSHPVTMELYSPQGQFYTKMTDTEGLNGFHVFHVPTAADDPTGTWNAYFKIGGSTFHKALMIESIKPNRLKIDLRTSDEILQSGKATRFTLSSSWLTGPAASGLESKVEMSLSPAGKTFEGYEGYVFSDPTYVSADFNMLIFDEILGNNGKASRLITMPVPEAAPGMMTARLTSRVTESGGDESITSTTRLFSPYSAYAGIRLPASGRDCLETDSTYRFPVAVVDKDGKAVAGHRLEYRIYKLDWKWWWESNAENLGSYVNGTSAEPWSKGTLTSASRPVGIPFRVNYPEWGRFLVYVKDVTSGHATGGIITADWPAYRGRSDKKDPDALTMLTFSTDKQEYNVGETVTVFVPAAEDGMALVSLENGSRVISRDWVKTSGEGDTPFRFKVTGDMAPNFYIHISLLQKHSNTGNDLPIRMYGVQPILVQNKDSHLSPVIGMPDEVRPLEEFTIKVSEKNGRKMTYTLAIVDEGLLDLTAFKTPDPWPAMYAREALGVKTWDLYDEVTGAFGGKFSPMAAIGGDQTINRDSKQDNRFNAVVKYLGPFTLTRKENVHKVTLPMYVGSVRVMLVAGQDGAYGNAEKTVPVKTPLMVLSTLPRVLGNGEEVVLPVNVFAMEKGIGNVSVEVSAEGPVKISGPAKTALNLTEEGDTLVRFKLLTTDGTGTAKVTVKASGGGYNAAETISVPVRNPNPVITTLTRAMVAPGESHAFNWTAFGESEDNRADIELAGFPSIDFNSCFDFMSNYRHNCTEQLAARGIALSSVLNLLSSDNAAKAKELIPALLDQLYGRQLPDGGFAYWPGMQTADEWATSMAGHFMSLAADLGYEVNSGVMSAWKSYQRRQAREWKHSGINDFSDLVQAYRLYSLAVASSPYTSGMNRMKEMQGLSAQAQWRLAAAYAVSGKKNIASEIIRGMQTDITDYSVSNVTYGSPLRDKAMILETLVLTGDMDMAMNLAEETAGKFSDCSYYTTQNIAFTAAAMGVLAKTVNSGAIMAEVIQGGKPVTIEKAAAACSVPADPSAGTAEVRNLSDGPLYATLSIRKRPDAAAGVQASSSGICLGISWTDMNGNPVSPYSLRQGTDFIANVTVTELGGIENRTGLALTFPVPSGWEIFNGRVFNGQALDSSQEGYSYLDIRDDMAVFYFDLPKSTRKTFSIRLRAAYEGTFVLPAVTCEQMYDPAVNANGASGTARVTD